MRNNGIFSPEELHFFQTSPEPTVQALYSQVIAQAKSTSDSNMPLLYLGYQSGDEACFTKAHDHMLKTAAEAQWFSEEYDPTAYEGYDIRTALETHYRCVSMSQGLTLFGDLLKPDEFAMLAHTTYEKGILPILEDWVLPGKRMHALDTMGHNFWIVTLSGCATALTLLYDVIPDAENLLRMAKEAIVAWFRYKGNPLNAKPATMDNGGYYESINYFDFSFHEYLTFACAYKRLFGEAPFDDTALLMQAADFIIATDYPTSKREVFVPFGDTDGGEMLYTPYFLLHYGIDHPALRWYVKSRQERSSNVLLKLMAWHNIGGKPAHAPEKLAACYDGIGWAMFKSTHDKDGDMLCVKCGDTWNHAHADAGHFVLFRHGDSEIHDACVGRYSSPNYIPYFTDSHAHNVLLFEGKGQDFRDNYKNHAHLPGKLVNFRDEDGFRSVTADATGPMSRYFRKHHRHFIWLEGFILIYDDVECYENGTVNYLLHAEENTCHRMLTSCTVSEEPGFSLRNPDHAEQPCTYLSYNRPTDDEGHVRFVSILLLDETLSVSFDETVPDWRLEVGAYTVYCNHRADGKVVHRNGIVTVGGYVTDALLLILEDGAPFAVVNGSIVRPADGGMSLLESLWRVTGRI